MRKKVTLAGPHEREDAISLETCWLTTSGIRCHVGVVRNKNQDRVGHAIGPYGEVFVVADGVGGEAGGAEAAGIAVEEFGKLPDMRPEQDQSPGEALRKVTETIQERISAVQREQPAFKAMASTAAVVFISGEAISIGHIGDSRIYLCRRNAVRTLTRDHSVVQRMVLEGILTEDEARTHPKSHILTQSLGQKDAALEIAAVALEPQDLLLLCSDGLWACVPQEQLFQDLTHATSDLDVLAETLLQRALKAGGPDNISILLVRFSRRDGWEMRSQTSRPGRQKEVRQNAKWSKRGFLLIGALLLLGGALALILTYR